MPRPEPRRLAYLTIATVDALGTGMFLPISVLFFVQSRHLSAVAVGSALTAASLSALCFAPVGARLIERWGAGRVLVIGHLGKAAAYAAYLSVGSPPQFFLAALLARSASQWARPAQLMMASAVARDGRRVRLLATGRALRNVAMSAGSGVVALVLLVSPGRGGAALIGADVASYLAAGVLAACFLPGRTAERARSDGARRAGPSWADVVLRSPRYLRAASAGLLLTLQTPLLVVAFPLSVHVASVLGGSIAAAAVTANTAAVALSQVAFSRGAEETAGAVRAMRRGALALAACCVPLAFDLRGAPLPFIGLLALAFVVLNTVAELWISAGSWGVALGLAPSESARHLTLYSSAESIGDAVGAGFTAVVVGALGAAGWWVFGGIAALATGLTLTLDQRPAAAAGTRIGSAP